MTLIYGYFIIFLLLIIFLYTLYIVGAYAPQYLKEIYNLTNTILFIMVFISFIASVKFYQYAKNIRYWLGNVIKIITDQIPTWISRLLFLLLGVIAVLVLNQMLNQLTRGIVNKLIGNIVNDCSNYSALIAGLGGFCLQIIIFSVPDLKVSFVYKNKIINNHKLQKISDRSVLTVVTTNKGRVKATYKILGICAENEKYKVYNNGLKSYIDQPKIYYRKDNSNIPIGMHAITLDENESCVYSLRFQKFPENNFFIVFLEMPNKLIFVPAYVNSDSTQKNAKNKKIVKRKWSKFPLIFPIFLLALSVGLYFPKRKADNKINDTKIKTEVFCSKKYYILQDKMYRTSNTYSIFSTSVKLRRYQIIKKVQANSKKYNCLVELSTANTINLYFNNCRIITNKGRKFNSEIEIFNVKSKKKTRIYRIVTNKLDVDNFKNIQNIELSSYNTVTNKTF